MRARLEKAILAVSMVTMFAPRAVAHVVMALRLPGTSTKDALVVAAPRHHPVEVSEAGGYMLTLLLGFQCFYCIERSPASGR